MNIKIYTPYYDIGYQNVLKQHHNIFKKKQKTNTISEGVVAYSNDYGLYLILWQGRPTLRMAKLTLHNMLDPSHHVRP